MVSIASAARQILLAAALASFLHLPARASLLPICFTNSLGQPDTNAFKTVPLDDNTPVLANGSVVTKGYATRWTPNTNGFIALYLATGNYLLTNSFLGRGIVYRFPDSSSNVTAYPLSGFNTFVTVVLSTTNGGGSGTATNLDAGATNQVKTLALQVADPLGTAASLPINFIGVTNGDLRGITTYGLWLFNGGVGINGTATWGANNASITAAGVISGNGAGITGLNSNNFSGQINLSQINPAPVGGGLTNNGNGYTLGQTSSNPSTNAPITFTDIPYQTNIYLTANNAGAALVNAATTSYGVILAIGDSMSEGQYGIPSSASFQLGQIYHNVYGDGGGGGYGTWEFGFNGGFYGRPDTSIWYGSVGPELYAGDGTNAADARQGAWAAPTNFVNQIAVSWVSWPRGSNFVVRISSLSSSYTNLYTLSSLAGTTNFNVTNLPASGNDNLVQFSALAGSNVICDVSFLGTNLGVQYWCEARGGVTLDNMLAVGTNTLAQMYNQIKPNELVYHAKDFGEQSDAVTFSNKLVQVFQFAPTNCLISLVGTPPIFGNSYRDNNFVLKQCCITHGWYYLDLWDSFSDFNSMTNSGLMADGTHPNALGATVWASKLYTLNNGLPATIQAANPPPGKYGAAIYNWSASSSGYALNYNGTGKLFLNQNALNFNDQFGRLSVDFSASGGIDVWNNLGIQLWGGGYIFSIFGALTLKSQSGIIFDPYNLGGGGMGGFATGNGTTNFYLSQGTVLYGNVGGATNLAITPFFTNGTAITFDKITGALAVGTNNFGGGGSGISGIVSTNQLTTFNAAAPGSLFSRNGDGSTNMWTQHLRWDGTNLVAEFQNVGVTNFITGTNGGIIFGASWQGGSNNFLLPTNGAAPSYNGATLVTNGSNGRIPAANIGQLSITNLPGGALTNNNAADVTLAGALTVTSTETLNGSAQLANNYGANITKIGLEEFDGFWLSTAGWRHSSTYIDTWTASTSPTFNTPPEFGWMRESANVLALARYTNTTSVPSGYASLKVATLTATNVTILGNLSAATNTAVFTTFIPNIALGAGWTNMTAGRITITKLFNMNASAISGFPGLLYSNFTRNTFTVYTNTTALGATMPLEVVRQVGPGEIIGWYDKSTTATTASVTTNSDLATFSN